MSALELIYVVIGIVIVVVLLGLLLNSKDIARVLRMRRM